MQKETMSVWRSRSGRLHWLRRCSGAGITRRVSVSEADLDTAKVQGQMCPCLWKVEFVAGKRARNY